MSVSQCWGVNVAFAHARRQRGACQERPCRTAAHDAALSRKLSFMLAHVCTHTRNELHSGMGLGRAFRHLTASRFALGFRFWKFRGSLRLITPRPRATRVLGDLYKHRMKSSTCVSQQDCRHSRFARFQAPCRVMYAEDQCMTVLCATKTGKQTERNQNTKTSTHPSIA